MNNKSNIIKNNIKLYLINKDYFLKEIQKYKNNEKIFLYLKQNKKYLNLQIKISLFLLKEKLDQENRLKFLNFYQKEA